MISSCYVLLIVRFGPHTDKNGMTLANEASTASTHRYPIAYIHGAPVLYCFSCFLVCAYSIISDMLIVLTPAVFECLHAK